MPALKLVNGILPLKCMHEGRQHIALYIRYLKTVASDGKLHTIFLNEWRDVSRLLLSWWVELSVLPSM